MPRKQPGPTKDAEDAAQRARAQKAAAMGPGRVDAEDVLADVIAVMDLDTRRLKLKAEEGEPLTVGESQTLGNYVRSLSQVITAKATAKTKGGPGAEEGMSEEQLEEELRKVAERTAKQVQHAQGQKGRS